MKKSIIIIALLAFGLSAFAQLPFTFDLGIKAGINSSQITTENASFNNVTYENFTSAAKSGYNIGAFARLGGKRLYLQPELLYCRRNSQSVSESSAAIQTVDLKSIQVPVLLGYKLINLKVASIRVFTGPAMSFVLNSSSVDIVASNIQNFNPRNFKNNIWDWQLGAGIDILKLTFDVRYEWGLTNTSDGNLSNIGFVNKGKVLTFSLGFKFI